MKPKQTISNTLLWQLSGDALPGVSYLFGTMHVKDERAFRHLNAVYAAMEQCAAFAAEFDLDATDSGISPHIFSLPEGKTLQDYIPPRKYRKMRAILLKTVGIDPDFLQYNQPILLANLIEEQIMMQDMPWPLDQHLWRHAAAREKTMLGIETLEEQVDILRQIPIEQQAASLLATTRHFTRYRRGLLAMAHWYETGNIRQLYQAARRGARGMRKLLLYNRNALMADRIMAMIATQTTFCAIGAAHLAGGKGVLRLLKTKGVHITPVVLTTTPNNANGIS
ncbi:MAG TPA: TraB/GumN family protein [Saprospiraceae bacterium]|nr:TraB/GumN family protein [Saprospiraceae bacterium]HMP25266.1 TraB/GumN family protein [Saprospiraceae bacterium]